MAPKPAPKKGKKEPLTEEEKKAKAEFEVLKAKEMAKKAIRDRRSAFKQAMFSENLFLDWGGEAQYEKYAANS